MASANFRFFARHQAEELGIEPTIVLEPDRRDLGPAIAVAAVLARQREPETVVMTLAAEHVILDLDLFEAACLAGRRRCLPAASSRSPAAVGAPDQLQLYPARGGPGARRRARGRRLPGCRAPWKIAPSASRGIAPSLG